MLWQHLTQDFIKRFEAGEFPAGGKFLTVSELCEHCKVSNMTARRVIKELSNANYIESAPGRGSLVKTKPKLKQIFIVSDFSNRSSQITMQIFEGIIKECSKWNIELQYAGYGELKNIHDDDRTGYIIRQIGINDLKHCQDQYGDKYKRMVCYDNLTPKSLIPCCNFDLETATEIALEYLISKGHRRIAVLGDSKSLWHKSRFETYRTTLIKNHLACDPSLVKSFQVSSEYSRECEQSVKELLQLAQKPSAVFCVSGVYALKLINVCHVMGIKIPQDLAVISIDNYAEMNFVRPRITTVDTHFSEVGSECVRMLIDRIEQPDKIIQNRMIKPHLVIRDSA